MSTGGDALGANGARGALGTALVVLVAGSGVGTPKDDFVDNVLLGVPLLGAMVPLLGFGAAVAAGATGVEIGAGGAGLLKIRSASVAGGPASLGPEPWSSSRRLPLGLLALLPLLLLSLRVLLLEGVPLLGLTLEFELDPELVPEFEPELDPELLPQLADDDAVLEKLP